MRRRSDGAGVVLQVDRSKPGQRSQNFELSCIHDAGLEKNLGFLGKVFMFLGFLKVF